MLYVSMSFLVSFGTEFWPFSLKMTMKKSSRSGRVTNLARIIDHFEEKPLLVINSSRFHSSP